LNHRSQPAIFRAISYYAAALALGGAIGWLDVALGEIFVTALLLLVCGMGFGLWRPRRGWAAGIALAVGVTAARIVIHLLRPQPHVGDIPASLLAAIPAVVGGAAGGLMRITARNIFGKDG
jgi:hypothetical protein